MDQNETRGQISIAQAVEAVLMTCDKPVKPAQIAETLRAVLADDSIDADTVRGVAEQLNRDYAEQGRSFSIQTIANGLRLMANPELVGVLAEFHGTRASTRLSRAALETLSIIAYRQPVTRAEIEAIRGVACGEVLRSLMDRRLVTIAGRAEELGRPMLYGTTKDFLAQFGLANIKDLPDMDQPPEIGRPEQVSAETPMEGNSV